MTGERAVMVRVAEFEAASDATLVSVGLGSCVAIVLHDPVAGVGGLAHVLLPDQALAREGGNPARFPATAVPALVSAMERLGARRSRLTARLVGGASMFASLLRVAGVNIGERNVNASRAALAVEGIPLLAEDTGGDWGRSVYFEPRDGSLEVRSLRAGNHAL